MVLEATLDGNGEPHSVDQLTKEQCRVSEFGTSYQLPAPNQTRTSQNLPGYRYLGSVSCHLFSNHFADVWGL